MKICRKIITLLLACVMIALFAGCGRTEKNQGESGQNLQSAEIQNGGTEIKELTFATSQTCYSLDHTSSYDSWYHVRYGVCQTLTKFNDDMSVSGWLTEDEYELSDDNLTWTMTIKDGVTFSNGKQLTAELAKASIEYVFQSSARAESFFSYSDIKADGQKLSITTTEPCANLRGMLADPLFVIVDTTADMTNITDDGPIGTGPFVFESFNPTTYECIVVKNENYWGGEVKLDKVTFKMFNDGATQSYALQTGEVDAAYNVSMSELAKYSDNDSFTVSTSPGGRTDYGFMNQNGQLGDKTLRRALIMCADRETYCSALLNNAFIPGCTPFPPTLDYGYGELTDSCAYDVEGANELLDEAGYADIDGDGYREAPDGSKIDLQYVTYTTRPELGIISEAFQLSCKDIGIKVSLNHTDSDTCYNRMGVGDYDILVMNINAVSTGDPENFIRSYYTCPTPENQNYNTFGYYNAEFEELISTLGNTFAPDERAEIVKQASRILMDEAVSIYFCYPVMNIVSKAEVEGFKSETSDYYWLTENVQIVN